MDYVPIRKTKKMAIEKSLPRSMSKSCVSKQKQNCRLMGEKERKKRRKRKKRKKGKKRKKRKNEGLEENKRSGCKYCCCFLVVIVFSSCAAIL